MNAEPLLTPEEYASYFVFRDKLGAELSGSGGKLTPWMLRVGYCAADKDMGLRRWCEITGTPIEKVVMKAPPCIPPKEEAQGSLF